MWLHSSFSSSFVGQHTSETIPSRIVNQFGGYWEIPWWWAIVLWASYTNLSLSLIGFFRNPGGWSSFIYGALISTLTNTPMNKFFTDFFYFIASHMNTTYYLRLTLTWQIRVLLLYHHSNTLTQIRVRFAMNNLRFF